LKIGDDGMLGRTRYAARNGSSINLPTQRRLKNPNPSSFRQHLLRVLQFTLPVRVFFFFGTPHSGVINHVGHDLLGSKHGFSSMQFVHICCNQASRFPIYSHSKLHKLPTPLPFPSKLVTKYGKNTNWCRQLLAILRLLYLAGIDTAQRGDDWNPCPLKVLFGCRCSY